VIGCGRCDVFVAVVTGMKQQRGVSVDADIPDAREQRAGRLAVAFDPKQLARLIVLADDRIEACELAAHSVTGGGAGDRRGGEQQKRGSDDFSHCGLFLQLGGKQKWDALGAAGVHGAGRLYPGNAPHATNPSLSLHRGSRLASRFALHLIFAKRRCGRMQRQSSKRLTGNKVATP
jgi:hypothetical protein